jgi:hypothetical protein
MAIDQNSLGSLSESQIRELAKTAKGKDKDKVLSEIAAFERTPPDVLVFLSEKSQRVRAALAKNPGLSAQLFEKLLADESPRVRAALAGNQNVSAAVLEKLAQDSDASVRAAVARSPVATPELLERLAGKNENKGLVLASIVSNRSAPPQLILSLVKSEDESVRNRGRGGEGDEMFFADESFEVLSSAAANPNTPGEALKILSRYRGNEIEWNLAKNPSTPREVLEKILVSGTMSAKRDMALNPALPKDLALRLAGIGDELCSANLASKELGADVIGAALDAFPSLRSVEKVALAAAKNVQAPPEGLRRLYEEFVKPPQNELVLFRLARNPATPKDVLARLAQNASDKVAKAALKNRGV